MKRWSVTFLALGLAASALAAVTTFTGPRHTAVGPAESANPAAAKKKPTLSDNDLGFNLISTARKNLATARENLRKAQDAGLPAEKIRQQRQAVKRRRTELDKAYTTAVGDFRKAAERNDAEGCYNLGLCFLNGNGVAVNEEEACHLFEKAAFNYERRFEYDPAVRLEAARVQDEKLDAQEARAISGYAAALYQYGRCLREGRGCTKDEDVGLEKITLSARLGHAPAEFALAQILLASPEAETSVAMDALSLLKRAAEKRLPEAMDAYAKNLVAGVGYTPRSVNIFMGENDAEIEALNKKEVFERQVEAVRWWYTCATQLQYPPAMVGLAKCFLDGIGVDRAGREAAFDQGAVLWLHRAAIDYGSPEAMRELALCCERGVGGLDAYGGEDMRHFNANWWRTRANAAEGDRLARIWLSSHNPKRFDTLILKSVTDK